MNSTYNRQITSDFVSTFRISLFDMVCALSTALDLLDPALGSHQKRTCLIAAQIARSMQLDDETYQDIFGAAMFHDIGAIGLADRMALLDFEEHDAHTHAHLGAILLSCFPSFSRYAPLVRCHHVQWEFGRGNEHEGAPVPLMSHLIYLADRIEVLAQRRENILGAVPEIVSSILDRSVSKFHPMFVDAFVKISKHESFWLDLFSNNLDRILMDIAPFDNVDLDLNQMLQFTKFFSLIIDSRSHFTATHSAGVAICAEIIAAQLGMNQLECTKMRMAGYLHDIGKLAIPSEYIEFEGQLQPEEMAKMRSHSYITLDILSTIKGLEDVAEWACCHHERLDGSGYPFHRTSAELSLGARVLAVADVYTALTEHRPYRRGIQLPEVLNILNLNVEQGKLDARVVTTLIEYLPMIEAERIKAQENEDFNLTEFWQMARKQ